MLMLMPENVMIMMVVRRPGWDRKPHIPNVYYTIFFSHVLYRPASLSNS